MQWALVAVVVLATVLSDLLQSREMKRHGEIDDLHPGRLGRRLAGLFRRPALLAAVACMAVSFFAFIALLAVADLSFAVPATAASYVLETALARVVLKERVNWRRWTGACLVAGGVALLAL